MSTVRTAVIVIDVINRKIAIAIPNIGFRYKGIKMMGETRYNCMSTAEYQEWLKHYGQEEHTRIDGVVSDSALLLTMFPVLTKLCKYKLLIHQLLRHQPLNMIMDSVHCGPDATYGRRVALNAITAIIEGVIRRYRCT